MKPICINKILKYNILELKNKLLIASPNIYEKDIFSQSIILITEQTPQETKGLIVNQVLKASSINEVIKMMSNYKPNDDYNYNLNLFLGGPVDYNQIHILHSNDYSNNATTVLTSEISITKNLQIVEDIKKNRGPNNYIMIMGYTNWYKNQLQEEIDANQWIIQEFSSDIIFYENTKLKWYMALQRLGINPDNSCIIQINEVMI